VIAIVGTTILDLQIHVHDWISIAGVILGLAALFAGIGSGNVSVPKGSILYGAILFEVLLALVGYLVTKVPHSITAAAFGFLAGLAFGAVGVAARALTGHAASHLFASPVPYALLAGGILGFIFYASGLAQGNVTTTTAALILAQVGGSAAFGILILGDHVRSSYLAITGAVIAATATLSLARFAYISDVRAIE